MQYIQIMTKKGKAIRLPGTVVLGCDGQAEFQEKAAVLCSLWSVARDS